MPSYDFTNFFNESLNIQMKKEKKLKPVVELLNHYGIRGIETYNFIVSLESIIEEIIGIDDE